MKTLKKDRITKEKNPVFYLLLKKTAAFLLGLITVILLLELGLFTASRIIKRGSPTKGSFEKGKNIYNILCLGDSFTTGLGAPFGESYPDHLQRMLNEAAQTAPEKIRIGIDINFRDHRPMNTSEILNFLENYLKERIPDLIIICAGTPNLWNKYGFYDFLKNSGEKITITDRLYRLDEILRWSFTKNLFQNLMMNIRWIPRREEDTARILRWIEDDLEKLIETASSNAIETIMINYPYYGENPKRMVNPVIERTAVKTGIPFINNQKIFDLIDNKTEGEKMKSDYYNLETENADPHPNSKGYNKMAEEIFNLIIDKGLLQQL